jgi:hypothetical protein
MVEYDVYTDMETEELTEVAYQIMEKWIAFALGEESINGRFLHHPTGRYASSIRIEGRGINHVAVVQDENIAPEGKWIEEGHGEIDMKEYLVMGKSYPMHRGGGAPVFNSTYSGRSNNVWAAPRRQGFTGYAKVTDKGWIIPAMTAYEPAKYLSDAVRSGDISIK